MCFVTDNHVEGKLSRIFLSKLFFCKQCDFMIIRHFTRHQIFLCFRYYLNGLICRKNNGHPQLLLFSGIGKSLASGLNPSSDLSDIGGSR